MLSETAPAARGGTLEHATDADGGLSKRLRSLEAIENAVHQLRNYVHSSVESGADHAVRALLAVRFRRQQSHGGRFNESSKPRWPSRVDVVVDALRRLQRRDLRKTPFEHTQGEANEP